MGIFVDVALVVLVLNVVTLDFVVVEDEVGSLVGGVGRVGRVAVRGGMRWKWSAVRECLALFGQKRPSLWFCRAMIQYHHDIYVYIVYIYGYYFFRILLYQL